METAETLVPGTFMPTFGWIWDASNEAAAVDSTVTERVFGFVPVPLVE